ncbi:4-(cytidine 5'-diphospho)-2-C-methyl-D-erythritol kinase [Sphingomonas sp. ID0503]|uniref:4-(cytidine 5'-diphospho)-2-C-methyl-D-erythritol kinase n=1 Tax=Sphingomonas sp. ID0503 TaxID=3399691 RepID=UPI003AFA2E77
MILAETAYAKINLALHVRRRSADGYHEIETIFAFAEDGDTLTAEAADQLTLEIDGPLAEGLAEEEDNLVLRAARGLGQGRGARIRLTKRLPIAAGLGGGSADAAAALRLLSRLWSVDVPDGLAESLGADVPACLLSQTSFAEGLGHPVTPIDAADLAGMPLLLVNPRRPLGTAPVYRGWDGDDRGPLERGDPLAAAKKGRNDLEPPALRLEPIIADVLEALEGATLSRMSGSGATCFALYADQADRDAAAARIAAQHPDWWQMATRLR